MVFRKLPAVFFLFILLTAFGSSAAPPGISSKLNRADHFTLYYFHRNFQSEPGKKLEKYTRDVLDKYFKRETRQGDLTFEPVNTDSIGKRRFLEEFHLYPKTLVLMAFRNGKPLKWKNLDKIWRHLNKKDDFFNYLEKEIENFITGNH